MRSQVENLTKENEQLKTKVTTLETDKAALEKKINEMEEMAKEDKKDEAVETSSSPKRTNLPEHNGKFLQNFCLVIYLSHLVVGGYSITWKRNVNVR